MISRVFGALGTMLSLIALYLLLSNSTGFTKAVGGVSRGLVALFATLQGRTPPKGSLA